MKKEKTTKKNANTIAHCDRSLNWTTVKMTVMTEEHVLYMPFHFNKSINLMQCIWITLQCTRFFVFHILKCQGLSDVERSWEAGSSLASNWTNKLSPKPTSTRRTCQDLNRPSHCGPAERCFTNCNTRRIPNNLSLREVMASSANCALGSSGSTASTHHTHAGPLGDARISGSRWGKLPKCCIIRAFGPLGSLPNQSWASLCTLSWSANNSEKNQQFLD